MKILLHGADSGSNFGDVLFAHLFYNKCRESGFDAVDFLQFPKFGIGEFCRNELNYDRIVSFREALKYDALILISGGYFGEDKTRIKDVVKRFWRFFLPAMLFQMTGKPLYILGVGGGPLISGLLRKSAVSIWNKAAYITVREGETKKYFEEYGVKREIVVTSDTAQVIRPENVPVFEKIEELREKVKTPKLIFVHLLNIKERDLKFAKIVVPAINRFIRENPEYGVIASNDWLCSKETVMNLETVKAIETPNLYVNIYDNSWQLCPLLNMADFVVTLKLHVGIVSAALGKSVISFPAHREKIQRYYRQIGEGERTVHLSELTEEIAYEQIKKFANKPIVLDDKFRELAQANLDFIDEIIKS